MLALLAVALVGCNAEKPEQEDVPRIVTHPFDNVMVVYQAGFNDLGGAMRLNLEDLKKAQLPDSADNNAVVVFSHCNTIHNYHISTEPVLLRAYSAGGVNHLDTLRSYASDYDHSNALDFRTVLKEVTDMFPADHYGLVYSAHGTSWTAPSDTAATRGVGARYFGSMLNLKEMDIRDFAAAMPVHFDYVLLDACFMASVEVAYQLRNYCDLLIASQAEILSTGFDYTKLPERLLRPVPALQQVCQDMCLQNEWYTVSLIDCGRLEGLAGTVAGLVGKYRAVIAGLDFGAVQTLRRDQTDIPDCDLRDIFRAAGVSEAEMAELDDALAQTVLFEQHTSSLSGFRVNMACGLSMYMLRTDDQALNTYYKTLDFNKAVRLVE